MTKIWKFFQYGYLIVAIICLIEGIVRFSEDREKAYMFLCASIFITLVFFFKRHFRKKVEKRNNLNK
jgi:uncharacterized membrane protein